MTSAVDQIMAAKGAVDMLPNEPLQLAVVSSAQLCLFDNFLHYFRLHQLVVFNTDDKSFKFCQERSGALASRLGLRCVEPVPCQKGTGCKSLADNTFLSPEYLRLIWLKPAVVQLALELGAESVLVMDIDNLQIKDFVQELATDDWKIQVTTNPIGVDFPNSGLIFASRASWGCVSRWVDGWSGQVLPCTEKCQVAHDKVCHCLTDQDYLNAIGFCAHLLSNETFFVNDPWQPPGEKVKTLHVVGVADKALAFKRAGLWHPDVLTGEDCSYSFSFA